MKLKIEVQTGTPWHRVLRFGTYLVPSKSSSGFITYSPTSKPNFCLSNRRLTDLKSGNTCLAVIANRIPGIDSTQC